jgi:hypothetical protein
MLIKKNIAYNFGVDDFPRTRDWVESDERSLAKRKFHFMRRKSRGDPRMR